MKGWEPEHAGAGTKVSNEGKDGVSGRGLEYEQN